MTFIFPLNIKDVCFLSLVMRVSVMMNQQYLPLKALNVSSTMSTNSQARDPGITKKGYEPFSVLS